MLRQAIHRFRSALQRGVAGVRGLKRPV